MTPEDQRIAIAEASDSRFCVMHFHDGSGILKPTPCLGFLNADTLRPLPDYLNDLNAMHEAERTLTEDQWERYRALVVKKAFVSGQPTWRCAMHATAAQRSEAFLRTLGLWKSN